MWLSGREVSQAQRTANSNVRDRVVSCIFVAGAEPVRRRVIETKSGEGRRLGPGRHFKDFGFFCDQDKDSAILRAVKWLGGRGGTRWRLC